MAPRAGLPRRRAAAGGDHALLRHRRARALAAAGHRRHGAAGRPRRPRPTARVLAELIERLQPDVMQATPATWRLLLLVGLERLPGMRALLGRRGAAARAGRGAAAARARSCGTSTDRPRPRSGRPCARVASGDGPVPIGRPIAIDADLRPRPRAPPGADRRARRAVDRRRRARARLPEAPGADRRALRAGSLRPAPGGAHVPDRRPGALARRRHARVPRAHRQPDQAARLPHRARRDRGRRRRAPGRAPVRGAGARGRARRPAPDGLLHAGRGRRGSSISRRCASSAASACPPTWSRRPSCRSRTSP